VKEAPKPEPVKAAEAPKPEPAKPEPPKAGDAPKAQEPVKTADAKKPAEAKKVAAPAKAPEADLIDEFTNFVTDPVSGGGLAAVMLLLVGYGVWAWRKKKAGQSSRFQDSVLGAATGGGAGSVFAPGQTAAAATPAAAAAAPGVSSEVSVESPSVGAAESDEVDPIAEADVYMAYGRNAQAEEILKEALAKDPSRLAVHAKLLEIYANQKDLKNFEQTALKVKSLSLGSGPEWDKAMALGHQIDPANGLYGSGGAAAAPAVEASAPAVGAPTLDFDIGGAPAAATEAKKEAPTTLDFDIGGAEKTDFAPGGTLVLEPGEQKAASSGLDFDLDKTMVGGLNLGAPPKKEEPKSDPDATVAMDFDLNLDLGQDKTPAPAGGTDLGSINLDLGTPGAASGGGGDAKWQEIATKLDLAKAYEEMGDKDGARELLNEVVKDGDAAQQSQAKQMLGNLG
jgi:pilus assembly protein FimV